MGRSQNPCLGFGPAGQLPGYLSHKPHLSKNLARCRPLTAWSGDFLRWLLAINSVTLQSGLSQFFLFIPRGRQGSGSWQRGWALSRGL